MAKCPFCNEEISYLEKTLGGYMELDIKFMAEKDELEDYWVNEVEYRIFRCPKCREAMPFKEDDEAEAFLKGELVVLTEEELESVKRYGEYVLVGDQVYEIKAEGVDVDEFYEEEYGIEIGSEYEGTLVIARKVEDDVKASIIKAIMN